MPMYVQTVQAGTPTTTPLDAYLANNVAPESTAQLSADAQGIHKTFEALPLPKAVNPEHLCATEEPVLVYQRNTLTMRADAYLNATPPDPPVAPVQPTAPIAPPKGCSAEEDAAYKAAVAQYKSDLADYQTAQATYQQNLATYQAMLRTWTDLHDRVRTFNASLQNWPSTSSTAYTPSAPGDSIKQIAADLDRLRKQRLSVKEFLKALALIDARIVKLAKAVSGDVTEADIAYAMALRDLTTLLYNMLLASVTDAAVQNDPAETFAI